MYMYIYIYIWWKLPSYTYLPITVVILTKLASLATSEFIQGTTFGGDIDDNKEELQAPVQPMTKISFKWHFLSG